MKRKNTRLALLIYSILLSTTDGRPQKEEQFIEGPGKESPIIPDSAQLPVAALPMEHRHDVEGPIVLPLAVREKRPGNLGHSVGAELFFSMWFVFLNNDVTYSDAPFTILAPIDSSKTPPEDLLENEALAEEVIANHFLIGEKLRPESLLKPVERFTAGGQRLFFKIDKNGTSKLLFHLKAVKL